MGLDKKLSQLMYCPLPTSNTHIIMSNVKSSTYINIDNIKHNIVKHGKYIGVDVDQMTDH